MIENCDTCQYEKNDEEDWPCKYCACCDRWAIAPDLEEETV